MKNFPLSILSLNQAASRKTALLFTFSLGSRAWRYTSSKDPVTFAANTYLPAPIDFDQIYSSGAPDDRPVTVKLGHVEPFISFVGHDIPSVLGIEIVRVWLDDLSFGDLIFGGTVDNIIDSDGPIELECRGLLSKLNQAFPALIVSPTCTLETYSPQCGLNRLDFAVNGVIAAIARNAVTIVAAGTKADGFFNHGYAECNQVRIGIETHVGQVLQLTVPPSSWSVGQAIIAYAGDDHRLATCRDKFDNEKNFLGLGIGMPDRNPVTQVIG